MRTGPTHDVSIGHHHLIWCRAQLTDNLHIHADGILLGRHSLTEELSDSPILHEQPIPTDLPAAFNATVIRSEGHSVSVEPIGVTNTFVSGTDASDRQLLLASLGGAKPSRLGVSMLASLGYFPGNHTLFDTIKRIPFLHRWYSSSGSSRRIRDLILPRADDAAMIERLVSVIPTDLPHVIGLSGGYDSRFMLGILIRSGAPVRIVRFTDHETEIARDIATRLDLAFTSFGGLSDQEHSRPALDFTLLSDAQIWHGVAQFGRLRVGLEPNEVFDSGQFSDSLSKNCFKSAWKIPSPHGRYWRNLVDHGIVANAPQSQVGLRSYARRDDLVDVLSDSLSYQQEYVTFRHKKQLANWLHYLNRATRWAQAYYDDLSFSTTLMFALSDLDAQLVGISSGAWDNFHNDRAARLSHQLLPDVTTPYVGGYPVVVPNGLPSVVRKLRYEYFTRLRTRQAGRARLAGIQSTYSEALPPIEPNGYDELFDRPMEQIAMTGSFGLRRASVTVANVLTYLDGVPL